MHPELIDTHAHLGDEQLRGDVAAVIARATAAGVTRIVTIATERADSHDCVALAAQYPSLGASVGIHPNHAAKAEATDWDDILKLAHTANVIAIGETGLDRHWDDTPFPMQEDYFARHLALSRATGLPVVIHCREAEADTVRMLRAEFERHGPLRGVMHSFAGAAETAEACLAMGLYVSFAGMLTYKNAQNVRDVARTIPLDRLLLETDSPYLAPVPLRGKRNEPANVVHTAACLADVRAIDVGTLATQVTANARALFFRLPS